VAPCSIRTLSAIAWGQINELEIACRAINLLDLPGVRAAAQARLGQP
jgi:hypothetical protein